MGSRAWTAALLLCLLLPLGGCRPVMSEFSEPSFPSAPSLWCRNRHGQRARSRTLRKCASSPLRPTPLRSLLAGMHTVSEDATAAPTLKTSASVAYIPAVPATITVGAGTKVGLLDAGFPLRVACGKQGGRFWFDTWMPPGCRQGLPTGKKRPMGSSGPLYVTGYTAFASSHLPLIDPHLHC